MDKDNCGIKVNVTTDKNEVLVQNKLIALESVTTKTFKTNKIDDFVSYISGVENPFSIYYDQEKIECWFDELDRYSEPVSICNFAFTPYYDTLRNAINKVMAPKEFESFLKKLMPYGEGFPEMLSHVNNHAMEKIVNISKSKDNKGNSSFQYTVKDSDACSFNVPNNLAITVPLLKHIDKRVVFKPLFSTGYRADGNYDEKTYDFWYKLEMLDIVEFTEAACISIIDEMIEKLPGKKYWGSLSRTIETNEWKYKNIPFVLKTY